MWRRIGIVYCYAMKGECLSRSDRGDMFHVEHVGRDRVLTKSKCGCVSIVSLTTNPTI